MEYIGPAPFVASLYIRDTETGVSDMFGNQRSAAVKRQITRLEDERDKLNDDLMAVRNELAELKRKKKHEDEDMRHLVKLKESQLEIEGERKAIEAQRIQQEAIAKVKDQYRDKMEKELQSQLTRMQGMYGEILGRLPNVNVRLKGDV